MWPSDSKVCPVKEPPNVLVALGPLLGPPPPAACPPAATFAQLCLVFSCLPSFWWGGGYGAMSKPAPGPQPEASQPSSPHTACQAGREGHRAGQGHRNPWEGWAAGSQTGVHTQQVSKAKNRQNCPCGTGDGVLLVECLPRMHKAPGFYPQHCTDQVWWQRPTMPALRKWRQEDRKISVRMGNIVTPCPTKQTNTHKTATLLF